MSLRSGYSSDTSPLIIGGEEIPWAEAMQLPIATLFRNKNSWDRSAQTLLQRHGMDSIWPLILCSAEEILAVHGMGVSRLAHVVKNLETHGLRLSLHTPESPQFVEVVSTRASHWSRWIKRSVLPQLPLHAFPDLTDRLKPTAQNMTLGQLREVRREDLPQFLRERSRFEPREWNTTVVVNYLLGLL